MDTQAIAERGCDAEQVDAEFARECDRERRLGINFRLPGSPAQAPGGSDPDTDDGKVPQTGCAGFRPRPNRRCRPTGVIQMLHAQIVQRAFNTLLLVEPSKAMAFLSGLGSRITGRRLRMAGIEVTPEDMAHAAVPVCAVILTNGLAEQYQRDGQTPFALQDGIAVIEISGVPVHRGAWIGRSSGQTLHEGIATQLAAAAEDPAVRRIAVEIGSFGDEVAGVFDLADAIRAARGAKPVWALIAEHAFSAGYALASQADRTILPRTILPRTGAVGSIGVVVMHADPHSALIEIAKRALKAVICLTSALSFHQLTDQLPRRIWFAVGAKDRAPRIDYRKRCASHTLAA